MSYNNHTDVVVILMQFLRNWAVIWAESCDNSCYGQELVLLDNFGWKAATFLYNSKRQVLGYFHAYFNNKESNKDHISNYSYVINTI